MNQIFKCSLTRRMKLATHHVYILFSNFTPIQRWPTLAYIQGFIRCHSNTTMIAIVVSELNPAVGFPLEPWFTLPTVPSSHIPFSKGDGSYFEIDIDIPFFSGYRVRAESWKHNTIGWGIKSRFGISAAFKVDRGIRLTEEPLSTRALLTLKELTLASR